MYVIKYRPYRLASGSRLWKANTPALSLAHSPQLLGVYQRRRSFCNCYKLVPASNPRLWKANVPALSSAHYVRLLERLMGLHEEENPLLHRALQVNG